MGKVICRPRRRARSRAEGIRAPGTAITHLHSHRAEDRWRDAAHEGIRHAGDESCPSDDETGHPPGSTDCHSATV
jgi:hypothetical protein